MQNNVNVEPLEGALFFESLYDVLSFTVQNVSSCKLYYIDYYYILMKFKPFIEYFLYVL